MSDTAITPFHSSSVSSSGRVWLPRAALLTSTCGPPSSCSVASIAATTSASLEVSQRRAMRLRAAYPQLLGQRLDAGLVDVQQGERGAARRESPGQGRADAAGRSRDHHGRAREVEIAPLVLTRPPPARASRRSSRSRSSSREFQIAGGTGTPSLPALGASARLGLAGQRDLRAGRLGAGAHVARTSRRRRRGSPRAVPRAAGSSARMKHAVGRVAAVVGRARRPGRGSRARRPR